MADLNKLLIAAMQRHITWESVDVHDEISGTRAGIPVYRKTTRCTFTLKDDIDGKTLLYVPEDLDGYISGTDSPNNSAALSMRVTGYDGTIRRGKYRLLWDDDAGFLYALVFHDKAVGLAEFFDGRSQGWEGEVLLEERDEAVVFPFLTAVFSDEPNRIRQVGLVEMLALIAAHDAREAGRQEDEDLLVSFLVYDAEGFVSPIDDMQPDYLKPLYEDIYARITEPKPLLIRGGGKQFTAAMGADTRTKGRRKKRQSDGAQYTRAGADNGLVIFAESGKELIADAGTNKLLCHIGNVIVRDGIKMEGGTATIHTSVGDILSERGLEATRSNKERVKEQIRSVMLNAWGWSDPDGTEHIATVSGGELTMKRGGDVEMVLSKPFMQLVMNHGAGIVPVDPVLLTTDDKRYQSAFAIGYRLTSHTFMNADKPNAYRISVTSLLNHAKAIPTAEEIEASDRGHQTSRIVSPFERSLDYLVELGFLKSWDYCHSNGESLTDAENAARHDSEGNKTTLPYDIARNCLVTWEPVHTYVGALQAASDAKKRKWNKAVKEGSEK